MVLTGQSEVTGTRLILPLNPATILPPPPTALLAKDKIHKKNKNKNSFQDTGYQGMKGNDLREMGNTQELLGCGAGRGN